MPLDPAAMQPCAAALRRWAGALAAALLTGCAAPPITPVAPAEPGAALAPAMPPAASAPRSPVFAIVEEEPASAAQSPPAPAQPAPQTEAPRARPLPQGAAPVPGAKLKLRAPLPFDGERHEVEEVYPRVAGIDLTVQPDDLWQRMRRGFGMPDLENGVVQEKIAWYAARPEYLKRMFERSRLYLFHIVEELEKRGLPTELALLPMVESSFNPMAYSRAQASGLWQFIPPTGKRFNLAQNWWFDARRDIVASTSAALDYLREIYELHGDWHLALASYNWGESAVARAIERNRAARLPTDYSSLTMPLETRQYVPKLQALKNIIANPAPFGIDLDPIPNQPYFTTVTKLRDIDVRLAARFAEMSVEEFVALNPGYNRPLMPIAVSPRIVLPADKVEVFHANLEKFGDKSLVSWQVYRPARGERLEAIAKRFAVPLAQLMDVNGIGPRVRATPPLLVVPSRREAQNSARLPIMYAPPIPARPSAPPRPATLVHVVQRGDTLAALAARYGVSAEELRRTNRIGRLQAGQRLVIRQAAAPGKAAAPAKPAARRARVPVKPAKK